MTQRAFTVQERSGAVRREATHAEILATVQRLLEQGEPLATLSVSRIATEAGVSRATFYLHFPDKRELVAKLAEQELLRWDETTAPFLDDPDASRAQLEQVALELVRLWRSHAGVLSGLIELAAYDPEGRDTWLMTVNAIAAKAASAVAARRPDLSSQEADVLGQMITWMGERSLHQMVRAEADDETVEQVAHGFAEAIWQILNPA